MLIRRRVLAYWLAHPPICKWSVSVLRKIVRRHGDDHLGFSVPRVKGLILAKLAFLWKYLRQAKVSLARSTELSQVLTFIRVFAQAWLNIGQATYRDCVLLKLTVSFGWVDFNHFWRQENTFCWPTFERVSSLYWRQVVSLTSCFTNASRNIADEMCSRSLRKVGAPFSRQGYFMP